ncbi:M56 family metallopeptidase [Maricaulis maris]|uniref:Beta-lactamase regulating signal transducer with metallopeptidase domain n=1 Tax=Maricaulis maris TaxID=74318 RepID=A0A495DCU1_9PROT|nr:M56 family metallopeptidase [Maricaulis maris]RKR00083.1 beta-lactamase regulating signal transducer with metallopeptidase domain [Maricaulis maris]
MAVETLLLAALAALTAATALAGLVVALDRVLPARFVRERHDLALAALGVIPLVFLLALRAAPTPTAADEPAVAAAPPLYLPVGRAGPVEGAPIHHDTPAVVRPGAGPANTGARLQHALLLIWLTGAGVMALRLIRDLVALHRMRSAARPVSCPATLRLSAAVPLAISEAATTPLLAGYRQPQILLPAGFPLDHAARPVLEHEIAHARRGDAWTVLALRVLQAGFWWVLPLLPLMTVLERNRETLCDREAARITGQPRDLALALLDAAARRTPHASLALAAAPSRSSLAQRVDRLTATSDLNRKDSPMRLALLLPALSATALVLTPQLGEARAMEGRDTRPSPLRDLDDSYDLDGRLYQAARRGQASRVSELLVEGANPDVRYQGDGTALIAAVRSGDRTTIETLLNAGADPDLGVNGDGNPMIAAAARGRDDVVQLLLASGADVDAAQSGDGNGLIAAALHGRGGTVDLLLAAGANPDAYVLGDETPMVNAAQQGHLDVIERLAAAGADLSLTVLAHSRDGQEIYRSPLSEARRTGQRHVVAWLEARGAEHREPAR